jgi:hypothetical protein
MFRSSAASLILLASMFFSSPSSAAPPSSLAPDGVYSYSGGRYWYCQVTPFSDHQMTYFSGVFGPTATGRSEVGQATMALNKQFADYMLRKYHTVGSGHCGHFNTADEAALQKQRNQALINSSKHDFEETGWHY